MREAVVVPWNRLLPAILCGIVAWSGCTVKNYFDAPDINIQTSQEDLERQQRMYEKVEKWRADPKRVAHETLGRRLAYCPWQYRTYDPDAYEVKNDRPDWGTYVVRGWKNPSNTVMRYRVKIRKYKDIWYPVQVSHYTAAVLPHPALEHNEPRSPHHGSSHDH